MTEKPPSITFRLDPRSGVHRIDNWSTKSATPWFLPFARGRSTSLAARRGDSDNDQSQHGARAYRELEHLGIAEGRAGLGTFITSYSSRPFDATERESLNANFVTQSPKPVTSASAKSKFELITLAFRQMATYVHDRRDGRSRDGEPGKALSTKMGLQDCTLTIPKGRVAASLDRTAREITLLRCG